MRPTPTTATRAAVVSWAACASIVALVSVGTIVGCGRGDPAARTDPTANVPSRERGSRTSMRGHGEVVARVDGVAIERSEVESMARESGVRPEIALERLIERELLVRAARRAGLDRDPIVLDETRRAAARALLAHEVGTLRESDVPQSMLDAAYAENPRRFDAPELRTVVHVLAQLPRRGARATSLARSRAVMTALRPDLVESTTEEMLAYASTTREGMSMVAERIGPFARGDAYAPSFIDATFALARPGDTSELVETSYGWHVIRLLEIAPPFTTPRAERDATLRRELLPSLRRRRTNELLRALEQRLGVSRDVRAVRDALRSDPLGAANAPEEGRGAPP